MPRGGWITTAVLGWTCLASPLNAGSKAFDVPESEFFSKVSRVVLAPCQFPGYFDLSDTLMARADTLKWQVDSLLVLKLEAAGLKRRCGGVVSKERWQNRTRRLSLHEAYRPFYRDSARRAA